VATVVPVHDIESVVSVMMTMII